jgi:hypothetical protein
MRAVGRGALLLLGACALGAPVRAHNLITAEAAERYLAQAQQDLATIKSREPAARRAEANVALGRMLDQIGELLNRDIASHGKVQGLASNYLIAQLQGKGAPLAFAQGRYLAHVAYYREALKLAPDAPSASEAMLRWMRGAFYDSFDEDPMEARGQSPEQLREQVTLGERFIQRYPSHPDIEEAQFILLVQYVRAARAAADSTSREEFSSKAREAAQAFAARYPDSMRAAAVPVLTEQLPVTKGR